MTRPDFPEKGRNFLDSLITSDLPASSHGITRLKAYADRVRKGEIASDTERRSKRLPLVLLNDENGGREQPSPNSPGTMHSKGRMDRMLLAAVFNSSTTDSAAFIP
jgi:hypothetical protein